MIWVTEPLLCAQLCSFEKAAPPSLFLMRTLRFGGVKTLGVGSLLRGKGGGSAGWAFTGPSL